METHAADWKIAGLRLREARDRLGVTQEHLGETIGLTGQQIGKYERGKDAIPLPRLLALSARLAVAPWWLAGWIDPQTPETPGVAEASVPFTTAREETLLEMHRSMTGAA